jgi:type III pantothenate kinase
MLLALEIGNTHTKIGVFDRARLLVSWRLTTRREQTVDEYGLFIETLLRTRGLGPPALTAVAISSVVPQLQPTVEWMSEKYFGHAPFSVEPGVNTTIPLLVDAPREVGADRVCNVTAAVARYRPPLVVIDLGTATKFDCVNARGEFIGGAIAPGIATSVDALISRAARLYRVELVRPKEAIGRNTTSNIQSGVVYGWAGLIDGIMGRIREEMGGAVTVVGTGGLVGLVADVTRSIEHVHADLTLEGLRLIWEHARTAGGGSQTTGGSAQTTDGGGRTTDGDAQTTDGRR